MKNAPLNVQSLYKSYARSDWKKNKLTDELAVNWQPTSALCETVILPLMRDTLMSKNGMDVKE